MLTRAEISARLKAARWLAGSAADDGKPSPLSVGDLVERPPLKSNRISKNRIESIEQARVDARSMELEKVAEALGVPPEWFTATSALGLISVEQMGQRALDEIPPRPGSEEDDQRRGTGA